MDTLLLQLVAPMQSWGVQSLHGDRDSGREPTKSGVIGLICAALGRDRTADIVDLAALRMGVRVDREGVPKHDFHKVEPLDRRGNSVKKDAAGNDLKPVIGSRHYLSDAAFLVGLEGDIATLEMVQNALRRPVYHLFLGRMAFPPARPVWLADGLRYGQSLSEALTAYPSVAKGAPTRRRLVVEAPDGEMVFQDQPVSFATRTFTPRRVRLSYLDFSAEAQCTSPN